MGEMGFEQKALVKAVETAWQEQQQERAAEALRVAQLAKSTAWMDTALSESTRESLRTAWILDIDTTIKLLYGHQAGAEIGYNPTKPGRPSHTLHTYWIGNLRLVLDVEVQGGKASAAKHSLPRLCQLLERLAPEERPTLVRGDNAFGSEGIMLEMEAMGQRYLFKLRQTAGVKRLIERQWQHGEWHGVGQGFDAVESQLRLSGWSRGAWWCCAGGSTTAWRPRPPVRTPSRRCTSSTVQTRSSSGSTPCW